MNYNTNILYNNYTSKNPSKRGYQTEPYSFYASPQSQRHSNKTMNSNQIPNIQNKNINISNGSNYNNQTIMSPNTKNTLRWRNIMKINLHQLKNARDLSVIQPNLDNLIFGDVTEEDVQSLPEMNIVKLIDILQTSCDILLNEQQELEGEMMKLENENIQVINKFKNDEKKYVKNKDLICRLKKEKKRDLSVLYSYQNVINNLRNGTYYNMRNITKNITDINIKNKNIDDTNINSNREKEFKCQYCPNNKSFMTEFELHKHLSEVHGLDKSNNNINQPRINQVQVQNQLPPKINIQLPPNYYNNENNNINNNDNNEDLLQKMDDMKRHFQETLTKIQEEKKREQEESKININRDNNNQDIIDKIENTFKDTLNDFKLMMENNNKKSEPQIIIQDNGMNNDDYYNLKNREISRLNEELRNMKNELNLQKRNHEIKKIELEKNILELQRIMQNKKYKEDEINNTHSNINISVNRQIEYQMEAIKNKENKSKTNFNSGKLVSDHDDTDEELQEKKRILELYNNDRDIFTKLINKKKVITQVNEINSTINQNNFFGKNVIEKENMPEISIIEEPKKDKIDINLKRGEILKKNIQLDNYYKRYIRRDKKYLLDPEFSNYFIDTLPKEFDVDPQINEKANDLATDKIAEVGVDLCPNNLGVLPEVEEDRLKEEYVDNLTILVNSLVNNMDKKNTDKKGKVNDYYLSIKQVIGFDDLIKTAQDIINKPKKELDTQIENKEEKKEKTEQDKDKDKDKDKEELLEKKKKIFENNKNENDKNEEGDKNNKNEIKNGVIISEIKDDNLEEIVLGPNNDNDNDNKNKKNDNVIDEDKDKDKESNTKLRNKPNVNNNKDNYIQNIKTDIPESNNKQNRTIVETSDIKINNNNEKKEKDNQLKNSSSNDNQDVPYTSTQAVVGNNKNIVTNKEERSDQHLDAPYSSHQNIIENKINQPNNTMGTQISGSNERTDKHLDAPYTSNQANIGNNINQQNNTMGTQISVPNAAQNQTGDVSYSSHQVQGHQANQ